MLPLYLKAQNFLSHEDSTLDFRKFDVACILGRKDNSTTKSCGSGKSAITTEAMKWCLYKKGRFEIQNKMVRRGTEEANVEFAFEINNDTYRVIRKQNRVKDKQDVSLEILNGSDWKNISASTMPETNQRIVELIGLDHEAFINTIVCEQHLAKMFFDKTNGERKEIFQSILPLKECDQFSEAAREKHNRLQVEVATLTSQVQDISSIDECMQQINQKIFTVEKAINELQNAINCTQTALMDLREKQKLYEIAVNQRYQLKVSKDKLEFRVDQLRKQIETLEKEVKRNEDVLLMLRDQHIPYKQKYLTLEEQTKIDISILKQQCETLQKAREAELSNKRKFEDTIKSLEGEFRSVEAQEATIKQLKDKCITCGKDWTSEEKKNAIDNLLKKKQELTRQIQGNVSKANEYNTILNNIATEFNSVKDQVIDYEEKMAEFNKVKETLIKIKGEADLTRNNIGNSQSTLQEKKKEFDDSNSELNSIAENISKLGNITEKDYKKDITDLEYDLRTVQNQLTEASGTKGRLEGELSANKKKKEEMLALCEKIKVQEHEMLLYNIIMNAFGKNGIQTDIIKDATQDIVYFTNQWCSKLSRNRFLIDIVTQKENKSKKGTFQEVFDIIVKDNEAGGEEIESCGLSGGELYQVAMSLRMALGTILANRIGTRIKFLLIDEAAVALDDEGVEAFAEVINILKEQFKICVVSHRKDLQAYFENIIWVEKENGVSRVTQG